MIRDDRIPEVGTKGGQSSRGARLASRWLQELFEILTLLQLFWRTGVYIQLGPRSSGAVFGETRHAMDRKGAGCGQHRGEASDRLARFPSCRSRSWNRIHVVKLRSFTIPF